MKGRNAHRDISSPAETPNANSLSHPQFAEVVLAATNPWNEIGSGGVLPVPTERADEILTAIARTLYNWPDETQLHLHSYEERYVRFIRTIAGYPEILPGTLPHDQPLHPYAAKALDLSLVLDNWPPLAGWGSLRSELLWIDRIRCSKRPINGIELSDQYWLFLTIAWLKTGLEKISGNRHISHPIIFDLLYDPEDLEKSQKEIGRAEKALASCSRLCTKDRRVAKNFARLQPDATHNHPGIAQIVQWLWWCRSSLSLQRGREGTIEAAPLTDFNDYGLFEVKFHRIKDWVTSISLADGDQDFIGIALRGASTLLGSVLSSLRIRLIRLLGSGNLLEDGGQRLKFLYGTNHSVEDLRSTIIYEIDHMLQPGGLIDRRFGAILRSPEITRHFQLDNDGSGRYVGALRELSWALIPPFSITFFRDIKQKEVVLTIPFRLRWKQSLITAEMPSHTPGSYRRSNRAMPVAQRLYVEVGVLAPRSRILGLHLAEQRDQKAVPGLPKATDPLHQLLFLDLNNMSNLFSRERITPPGVSIRPFELSEAVSRRSFRFASLWLEAIRTTLCANERTGTIEPMVLAGDDLLVGSRSPHVDMAFWALSLHNALRPMSDELPPDQGISFAAALFGVNGVIGHKKGLLQRLMILEKMAKKQWKSEIAAKSPEPWSLGPDSRISRIGYGLRMSLLLECPDLPDASSVHYELGSKETFETSCSQIDTDFAFCNWDAVAEKVNAAVPDFSSRFELDISADTGTVFLKILPE